MSEHTDRYADMLGEVRNPWCWACGRGNHYRDRPGWWYSPWIVHRHHIVRQPRRQDRRAVILLCPICHGVQHGERYPQERGRKAIGLPGELWIKLTRDRAYYDRAFLASSKLGRLPGARVPSAFYRREYCTRRGALGKL